MPAARCRIRYRPFASPSASVPEPALQGAFAARSAGLFQTIRIGPLNGEQLRRKLMGYNGNAVVAIAVAIGSVALSGPAQARISDGTAVGVGILGLGVGVAIASDHRHRYYDGGYYAPPPPPPAPVYYVPQPPPSYSYEYVQRCWVFQRWDPYWGRYRQTRHCG